jgi:hypothetical protein
MRIVYVSVLIVYLLMSVDAHGQSLAALTFSTNRNATLLVTDPNGKKTGYDGLLGTTIQSIPSSAYFVDQITDDVSAQPASETSHSVSINNPNVSGTYTIGVTGLRSGPLVLEITGVSTSRKVFPPIRVSAVAAAGSTASFVLTLSPSGSILGSLNPIIGDVNGDAVVDCSDVAVVRCALGKRTGQAGFDGRADVNADRMVDVRDLDFVSQKLPKATRCSDAPGCSFTLELDTTTIPAP